MNGYRVKIIERLSIVVPVQQESADSALEKVQAMYRDSKIVLTADDYVDTEFEVIDDEENTGHVQETEQTQSTEHIGSHECRVCGSLYSSLDATLKTIPVSERKPPLREVYIKIGSEVIGKVPVNFIEYSDFWSQHSDDTGFVMAYLDAENRIVD